MKLIMSIRKLFSPILIIWAALAVVRLAFERFVSEKRAASRGPYADIETYIERQMHRLKIPGLSLAIVEGEKIVCQRGFGRIGPGGPTPTPQSPFFIGSLTKSFTALATMQLVEAGQIDVDAPVQHYLPWFRLADPQASAQITVRHLLNQTSGLPTSAGEYPLADFDQSPGATERQARALATLELTGPVGSAVEYCNMNYNLLGLIIEAASGETYASYVQEHIFNPLGMRHTTASPAKAKQNGLATGYQYWFAYPFPAPDMPLPAGSLPGGLLISSAEDMARYLIMHLNGGRYGDRRLLSSAGIDEMHRGATEFLYMGRSLGWYGMGWYDDTINQTRIVWHNGTLPHFFAYMALLPEQKKGVVLLFNASQHWMSPVQTLVGGDVAALLAGEQPQPAPMAIMPKIPWLLRGQLLLPALQVTGVVATLRRMRRWRQDPLARPNGRMAFVSQVLLPLITNLSATLSLLPLLGKRRRYLMLYMPDYSWTAMLCSGFALAWSILRTGLVLRVLRKTSPSSPAAGQLAQEL
jgi:CubicO group peptidase (beta-lactamase class C family)